MKIRPYTHADQAQGVEIMKAALAIPPWPEIYRGGWDFDRIVAEFLPLKDLQEGLFLVAEIDGVIEGGIAGVPLKLFLENDIPHLAGRFENVEETFYQRDIILDPTIRGGHMAYELSDEIKKFAVSEGFKYLATRTHPKNERGMKFFNHLGYRETITDDNPERIYYVMDLAAGA